MKIFVKIVAFIARRLLSDEYYVRLRMFYYSFRETRVSQSVSADGFLEWYANHINRNVPVLATRLTPELMKTGEKDLKLLKKHGLRKNNSLFEHGVGYFRASAHFVEFLNKNKYVGNDISSERVALGIKNNPDLVSKGAVFHVSTDNFFQFPNKRRFDFLYSSAVVCHMPPEDIIQTFTNMRKNLMHERSNLLFNYSVLDFDEFLFIRDWGREEVLRRFKKGTIEASAGLQFRLMEKYQGREMLTIGKTQFFHSRKYMEQLVVESGLRFVDISEPLFQEDNSSYLNTRIIKAYI